MKTTTTLPKASLSLFARVQAALDMLRPFLQKDNGDAKIVKIENDTVHIELLGACATCPMSNMTFQNGIEKNIKQHVNEINHVIHHPAKSPVAGSA